LVIVRIVLGLIGIILAYVAQSSIFVNLKLAGAIPDLLIIIVMMTAFVRGRGAGMFMGLFSGLLIDFAIGDFIGMYAFIYLLVGYFAGYSNKIYNKADNLLPLGTVLISELIINIYLYVCQFLLRGRAVFGYVFFKISLPRVIYTLLVALIVYKPIILLIDFLSRQKSDEEDDEEIILEKV